MSTKPLISVIIPSRNRAQQLHRCLERLIESAPEAEVIVVPDGCKETAALVSNLPVSVIEPPGQQGALACWNLGAQFANGVNLALGADDLWFHDGWYEAALEGMNRLGGYGVVGINDLSPHFKNGMANHYVMSRAYARMEMGGVLVPPVYKHMFVDAEVTARAARDGRLYMAEAAIAEHRHPLWDKAENDAVYVDGTASLYDDQAIFEERQKLGFPNTYEPVITRPRRNGWGQIGVGFRCGRASPGEFINSWTMLMAMGLARGDRIFAAPLGLPHHMAANELARNFLKHEELDSLLMIDDDMQFDHDALRKLRQGADVDILQAFTTHRNAPPHAVVLQRLDPQPGLPTSLAGERFGALKNIPDNTTIMVDTVGMAFTLIRREVLESMIGDYGATHTFFFEWGKAAEGEDVTFSRRAKNNGFSLAVDTRVKVNHLGAYAYGWDDHQRWVRQLEMEKTI